MQNTKTYILVHITTMLFQEKNVYDFNACNNVRDILYTRDVVTSTVQLIVHSSVCKLVKLANI